MDLVVEKDSAFNFKFESDVMTSTRGAGEVSDLRSAREMSVLESLPSEIKHINLARGPPSSERGGGYV